MTRNDYLKEFKAGYERSLVASEVELKYAIQQGASGADIQTNIDRYHEKIAIINTLLEKKKDE